jgi:hypothetical protein
MNETYWSDTEADPDRRERRMAECLVLSEVPWDAFLFVGAKSQTVADEVQGLIGGSGPVPSVAVRPRWYF